VSNHIPEGLEVHRVQPKPVEAQAVHVTTDNIEQVTEWITGNGHSAVLGIDQLTIQTYEGPFTARPGDVVVRGLMGFQRTEGGDAFKETYDDLGPVEL
jgi:hypothetical protein